MSSEQRGLAGSAALMFSGTLVSRLLGLLRNLALVGAIGVTGAGNSFAVANKLPNVVYMLVAGGVLNAILVPQIVRAMRSRDGGEEYVDRLLTMAGAALLGLTLLLTGGAVVLVSVYASELSPEWFDLAVAFAVWCIPQLFFYGMYTLLGQVLNARGIFGPYMWAPAANNLVAIIGLVAYIVVFGGTATGAHQDPGAWDALRIAAIGGTATLGVAVQAIILIVPLRRAGFRFRPRWGLRGSGLGRAGKVGTWAFASLLVAQLGFIAISNLAAAAADSGEGFVAGNAAWEQANFLYLLPQSLITVSLVTAMFTRVSDYAAAGDTARVRDDLSLGLRTIAVFTMFAGGALAVLALPLVQAIVPTTSPTEAQGIARIVVALLLGIGALGAFTMIQRVYYAFEDTKSLFKLQIPLTVIVIVGCLVSTLLPPEWWLVGAGVATALSNVVGSVVAYLALRLKLPSLDGGRVLRTHLRLGIAVTPTLLLGWWLLHLLGPVTDAESWVARMVLALLKVALVGGVMLGCYVLLLRVLRVAELEIIARPVVSALRRLSGRRSPAAARTGETGPEGTGAAGSDPAGPGGTGGAAAAPTAGSPPADDGTSGRPPGAGQSTAVDPAGTAPAAAGPVSTLDQGASEPLVTMGAGHRQSPGTGPDGGGRTLDDHGRGTAPAPTRSIVLSGRYRLDRELPAVLPGTELWRGHDEILEREIGALLLPSTTGPSAETVDAARRAALVDDPRIQRVLDVGAHDGRAFVVTDSAKGPSLGELATSATLPAEQARAIIGEVASALEAARRRGVHHLVLGPSAVSVTADGQVRLAGIGIAAAYLGIELDPLAAAQQDTDGLVRLLYLALTGTWPAPADGRQLPAQVPAAALVGGTPVAPSSLRPDVPDDLDALCRRTFAGEGPHTPSELIRELAPWLDINVEALAGEHPVWPLAGTLGAPGATGPAAPADQTPGTAPAQAPDTAGARAPDADGAAAGTGAPAVAGAAAGVAGAAGAAGAAAGVAGAAAGAAGAAAAATPAATTAGDSPADAEDAPTTPSGDHGSPEEAGSTAPAAAPPTPDAPVEKTMAWTPHPADVEGAVPAAAPAWESVVSAVPAPAEDAPPTDLPTRDVSTWRPRPLPADARAPEDFTAVVAAAGEVAAAPPLAARHPRGSVITASLGATVGGAVAAVGETAGRAVGAVRDLLTAGRERASAAAAERAAQREAAAEQRLAETREADVQAALEHGRVVSDPPPARPPAHATPPAPAYPPPPTERSWESVVAEPEVVEEEGPVPFRERRLDPTPIVLAVALVAVVIGAILAFRTLTAAPDPVRPVPVTQQSDAPTAEPAPEPEVTSTPEQTPEPEPTTPPEPPEIAALAPLDPEGDGAENPELTPNALDGDPSTYWRSRSYVDPEYGMKSGIGLHVELEEETLVSAVVIDLMGEGGNVEIRATSASSPTEGDVLASGPMGPATTFTFDEPVETDELVLWFTSLPVADSDGRNRIELAELEVE